jgi:hypothetical protein
VNSRGDSLYVLRRLCHTIYEILKGGTEEFKTLDEAGRIAVRIQAIASIQEKCPGNNTVGVVAGHHMFWDNPRSEGEIATNKMDPKVYTHILYLVVPASE